MLRREAFRVFARPSYQRCRARACDTVYLAADRRDEHIAAQCSDGIEENAANGARKIATCNAADAGDELVASQARVIDMNDAVSGCDMPNAIAGGAGKTLKTSAPWGACRNKNRSRCDKKPDYV